MKNLTKIMIVFGMIAFMAGNPPPGIAKDVGTMEVPFVQETVQPINVDVITLESNGIENVGMWAFTNEVTFQVNDMASCKIERSWPAKAEHFTVMKSLQSDAIRIPDKLISWCAKELFIDPGSFICPVYRC